MALEIKDLEYWDSLKKKINQNLGFNCEQYSDKFLQRRIEVRLRSLNLESYFEYGKVLDSSDEKEKLEKELTIHVTHFFRDMDFWQAFMDDVIPELLKMKRDRGENRIRIWSAGSSTGEEAISIVICLKKKMGLEFSKYDIKVIGTDYDKNTVGKAQEGVYEEPQFREMPPEMKDKYFSLQDGKYRLKDDIRNHLEFSTGDILSSSKPRNIDIIFCRNTVIYFEQSTKARLYEEFYELLNDNGFFIMGKTETLNGPARDKFSIYNGRERIYRK